MFEPKVGECFHCGGVSMFPSNWKNDWFICNKCLDKIMPLLRRRKPFGMILKSENELTPTTLWKPFKIMDMAIMERSLVFAEQNEELEKDFHPTRILCGDGFELDEEKELFRVRGKRVEYSPIFPISEVKDFYVQDVYQCRQGRRKKTYRYSELCIELDNEILPFVEFGFEFSKEASGLFRSKKKMRAEAEAELSDVIHCKTSETRQLIHEEYYTEMEYNPFQRAQDMREDIGLERHDGPINEENGEE